MKFKIGDRVISHSTDPSNGRAGFIVGFRINMKDVLVDFGYSFKNYGHNGEQASKLYNHNNDVISNPPPKKTYYWVYPNELKICKETTILRLLSKVDEAQD